MLVKYYSLSDANFFPKSFSSTQWAKNPIAQIKIKPKNTSAAIPTTHFAPGISVTKYHTPHPKKPTVISTNLLSADLRKTYGDRIASRLLGEYLVHPFYGVDVRKQKLMNQ